MMTALVEGVAAAAQPWADFYSDSAAAQVVIPFLHLGGLLVSGGLALSADRQLLRASSMGPDEQVRLARELESVHTPVLTGLAIVLLSGMALLAADVAALLPSPVFWLKMGGFVLLLANGAVLKRAGERLAAAPLKPAPVPEPVPAPLPRPAPAAAPVAAAAEERAAAHVRPRATRAHPTVMPAWRAMRAASLRSGVLWLLVLLLGTALTVAV